MNSEIKIFNNSQFGEIRTIEILNEPYFIANDVCSALGYSNSRDAVNRHVDSDDKSDVVIHDGSQNRKMTAINEAGIYSLVFGSNLETAKQFKKWVTSEVLPAIRKTGGYVVTTPEDSPEIIMARGLMAAKDAIDRLTSQLETKSQQIALQQEAIKQQAPKVDYYNEVLDSEGLISTTLIAKDLGMSAMSLNKKLNAMGIIYRNQNAWVPYSKYQGFGYCKSKTFPYVDSNGKQKTAIQFYWTEKGREFIMGKFSTVNA